MPRQLVYYVACTLDGFIARIDGSFDCFLFQGEHFPDLFTNFPETFPAHIRPALGISGHARHFDTVLMGRSTYEIGLREGITNPYAPLRQYVFSHSMTASPDPAVHLHSAEPLDLVRRLKAEEGKDIWLCGGGKLASALAPEIDELILKINPILLGSGIPLFHSLPAVLPVEPLDHKFYPNGFHLAHYRIQKPLPNHQ